MGDGTRQNSEMPGGFRKNLMNFVLLVMIMYIRPLDRMELMQHFLPVLFYERYPSDPGETIYFGIAPG